MLGHSLSKCMPNLKILALIGAEKSVTENLIGEKEKWTNKGNKQEEADSLLHNRTSHTICTKFQNPRFLMKKKKYTHTHSY